MSTLDYLTRTFGDPISEEIRRRVGPVDISKPRNEVMQCFRGYDLCEQELAKQIAEDSYTNNCALSDPKRYLHEHKSI